MSNYLLGISVQLISTILLLALDNVEDSCSAIRHTILQTLLSQEQDDDGLLLKLCLYSRRNVMQDSEELLMNGAGKKECSKPGLR